MNHRFEEVEHTADIAIRVWGEDLGALFAAAAYGMACQLADPDQVEVTTSEAIDLQAFDTETLLVAWLGELLYLGERKHAVFTQYDMLEVGPDRLRATVGGGPIVHQSQHIKAVTFSDLRIVCTEDGYETTIVFDV